MYIVVLAVCSNTALSEPAYSEIDGELLANEVASGLRLKFSECVTFAEGLDDGLSVFLEQIEE